MAEISLNNQPTSFNEVCVCVPVGREVTLVSPCLPYVYLSVSKNQTTSKEQTVERSDVGGRTVTLISGMLDTT